MNDSSTSPAARSLTRFLAPLLLLAVMWAIQLVDALLPGSFIGFGLRSWDLASLPGLVTGPVLHAGWSHLIANSIPFVVLGCLVAADGAGRFWAVTGIVALVGGVGTWIVNAPGTLTVGASVLVFGYFGYIVLRVLFAPSLARGLLYAGVAAVAMLVYGGSMLTGVLAAPEGVSWQAHLFGAIGGALAAGLTRPRRSIASTP